MSRVGRYEIVRELGRGGMGVVGLAEDGLLDRLESRWRQDFRPDPRSADWRSRRALIREAQSAASLNHPNLVDIHDVLTEADATYMVIEFIDGITLSEMFRCSRPPPR